MQETRKGTGSGEAQHRCDRTEFTWNLTGEKAGRDCQAEQSPWPRWAIGPALGPLSSLTWLHEAARDSGHWKERDESQGHKLGYCAMT